MKQSLLAIGVIFTLFISCRKQITPEPVISGVAPTDAALSERVRTLKNVGQYSDQNLAAARNGGGIVFGGNSLVERMLYSNWDATWRGYPVINRGIGGTTWAEQIPYIDALFTD